MNDASRSASTVAVVLEKMIAATRLELGFSHVAGPPVLVRFSGEDVPMLLADEGRLLEALRLLATDVCGLSDDDVIFDTHLKAKTAIPDQVCQQATDLAGSANKQ